MPGFRLTHRRRILTATHPGCHPSRPQTYNCLLLAVSGCIPGTKET
jgi:hypothetical protein